MFLAIGSHVQAHTVTEVGDYAIIAAWENEPPVVGEWNAITIDIFNTNGEISATDVTLRQFELVHDGLTRAAVPSQSFDETLHFRVAFIPTIEGEIGAHLVGTLAGETFDVTVYPERVEPARIIQFPEVVLSNGDLQAGLIRIEERIATQQQQLWLAYLLGGIGIAVGIIGVRIAVSKRQILTGEEKQEVA